MTIREAIGRAIPIGLLAGGMALAAVFYNDYRNRPVNALRAGSAITFEYPVPPNMIIDAIATAYGVYVNFEYPNDPGGEAAYLPDMQPSAEVGDSLQSFFNSVEAESDGLFEGLEIGGALCIVPKQRLWTEHRSNLDRIIGADIADVSAADALRAIVSAVNQYSVDGYPLKLNPGGVRAGFVPPESFRTEVVAPLRAEQITAREAICRVLTSASQENSWVYGHSRGEAYLTIKFYEDGSLVQRIPGSSTDLSYWHGLAGIQPQP